MTTIAVVTGNPKPASRTHGVALAVADAVAKARSTTRRTGWSSTSPTTPRGCSTGPIPSDPADRRGRRGRHRDFASPTYKASYTGLLKAFLDRYGSNGLAGITAVPVMTGGWPGHLLAVEVHLRPVLVELGASVPSRGLYVTEPELADLDNAVGAWSAAAMPLIKTSTQNKFNPIISNGPCLRPLRPPSLNRRQPPPVGDLGCSGHARGAAPDIPIPGTAADGR